MKKIAAWLLALLLLFAFVACGSPAEEPDEPESPAGVEDEVNSGVATDEDVSAQEDEASGDPEREDASAQEGEEPETEPEQEAKKFALGTVSGQVWENEYLGLGCEFPDSWVFSSEQEIAELNGATQEYVPEDFAEQMANADIVYDMMAQDPNGISNVNVNFQKLTAMQIMTYDTKATIEATLDIVKEAYENMGYTNVSATLGEVEIDGETLECMYIYAEAGGLTMYVKTFSVLCDRHVGNITLVAPSEAELQQIAAGYYWL